MPLPSAVSRDFGGRTCATCEHPRRPAGLDGVARQVALDVAGQAAGRLVPPAAVFLEGLHHDPVEIAAHQPGQPGRVGLALGRYRRQRIPRFAQPRAGPGWLFLADLSDDLGIRGLPEPCVFSSGVEPVSNSYKRTPSE